MSNLAYTELAPHSIYLVVLADRRLVAARAFALDAKADIAAFVAEHKLSGTIRASFLGGKNYLHRSGEAESGAVRQAGALQGHAAKLPHGFDSSPVAVAVDAASGLAPDAARVTPWLLAAVDAAALSAARDTLGSLGLAPADLTLAAPAHLGAIAGSLATGETALVVFPGDDEAQLAWVTSEGVQSVAVAPVGYVKIYEAVQLGLGLKFKAAAGKLFYNETYDFGDAAPKIAEPIAAVLKEPLAGNAANYLHIAGLVPTQAWLVENVAKALGLRPWSQSAVALASRLGLDAGAVALPSSASGLVQLAGAGSGDAAWVQPVLETLVARPRTATPFPGALKSGSKAPMAVPAPPASESAYRPAAGAKPGFKAPANASPTAQPAQPVRPAPVVAVSVAETPTASAPRKNSKGPLLIAATVSVVVGVVGLAAYFRRPAQRPEAMPPSATPAPTASATPAPVAPAPSAPVPSVPAPAPVVVAPPAPVPELKAPAADLAAGEPRKFSNDRYRFEVTEKGFIQALSTTRDEVLVESAAGISLQGSYVGTDGRRKWFNVGGVDDLGYQATVKKAIRDGVTIFDVKVVHPRFELEQTFSCLPDSIKVAAKFTPINLRDPRGVIAAVHSVRLSPVALNPSLRMRASADVFAYAMKAGTLRVSFDSTVWARDGADGRQTIIAGENGVAFHFTETTDATRNMLNYEIAVP